jgi:hypothetical protein
MLVRLAAALAAIALLAAPVLSASEGALPAAAPHHAHRTHAHAHAHARKHQAVRTHAARKHHVARKHHRRHHAAGHAQQAVAVSAAALMA